MVIVASSTDCCAIRSFRTESEFSVSAIFPPCHSTLVTFFVYHIPYFSFKALKGTVKSSFFSFLLFYVYTCIHYPFPLSFLPLGLKMSCKFCYSAKCGFLLARYITQHIRKSIVIGVQECSLLLYSSHYVINDDEKGLKVSFSFLWIFLRKKVIFLSSSS